ncbi:MAG TPA: hypothetical protein VGK01_23005 [Candidatus Angelobacter sp.]|jgi:hypothetical protein
MSRITEAEIAVASFFERPFVSREPALAHAERQVLPFNVTR